MSSLKLTHDGWIIFRGDGYFVSYRELTVKAIQRLKGIDAEIQALGDSDAEGEAAEKIFNEQEDLGRKLMRACAGCIQTIRSGPLKGKGVTADGVVVPASERLPKGKGLTPLLIEYEDAEGEIKEALFSDLSKDERIEALLTYGRLINQIISLVRHDDEAILLGK